METVCPRQHIVECRHRRRRICRLDRAKRPSCLVSHLLTARKISNLKSRKSDLNSEISDFKFQSGAQKSGDTGHARSRNPGFLPRTFFACAIGIALVSLVVLGLVAFRQGSDAASTSLIETVPARRSIAIPPGTAAPKAEFHAQRALILDADLAGAYIVLGVVRTMKNYDLRTREDYYKQALVKNPNHRTARL